MANIDIRMHPCEIEYMKGCGSYNANDSTYNQTRPGYSVGHALDELFNKIKDAEQKIKDYDIKIMNLEISLEEHKTKEEEIIKVRNENKWVDELYTEAEVAGKLVSS